MNKYAAVGLAAEAAEGRRILVITETQAEAESAIACCFNTDDPAIQRIVRTSGQQQIDYKSGGSIKFRSYRSSGHRGVTVDTVFLDTGVDQAMSDPASVMACIAASTAGTVVRA